MPLALLLLAGCSPVRLDEHLCPIGQTPARTTLLLLDTSDPLSPKHREVFERLIREMQEPSGPDDFRIKPGEKLIVYELSADPAQAKPVVNVCNPGDRPDSWTFKDDLTGSKMIALRKWRQFRQLVEPLFAEQEKTTQPSSPILEFLSVIVPRHVGSARAGRETAIHLIVFSDLLQHSDSLSHYGPYPEFAAIRQTAPLRHLKTDLSGVEISLYRLERRRDARWQTTQHYYWWTKLVQDFGGQVIYQESV